MSPSRGKFTSSTVAMSRAVAPKLASAKRALARNAENGFPPRKRNATGAYTKTACAQAVTAMTPRVVKRPIQPPGNFDATKPSPRPMATVTTTNTIPITTTLGRVFRNERGPTRADSSWCATIDHTAQDHSAKPTVATSGR